MKTLENLRNNQIYFSSPIAFNDPFDCILPSHEFTDEEFELLYKRFSEDTFESKQESDKVYIKDGKVNDDFKDHVRELYYKDTQLNFYKRGIACFSEKSDDILMWSHYADSHKGICLEFDTSFDPFDTIRNVTYSDKLPEFNMAEILVRGNYESYFKVMRTKHIDWKYEKEWRILTQNANSFYKYKTEALTSIFFGSEVNISHLKIVGIIGTDSNAKLNFYKMMKKIDRLAVIPKLIDPITTVLT